MGLIEEHEGYALPNVRPILRELRRRIQALGKDVAEGETKQQRVRYSVVRIFAELKVQKKCVLVRFFDMGIPDPKGEVRHIPYAAKQNWQHDKEVRVRDVASVDYAMRFIEASYRSSLTRMP
jgi:predicted transport protein